MASTASSRWSCWKTARTSMTESISAPAGVYLPDRRLGRLRRESRRARGGATTDRGVFRAGKGEETPAAIGLDRVAEMDRLGVGEADDRRRMEAHADREARGQVLIGRLAGR